MKTFRAITFPLVFLPLSLGTLYAHPEVLPPPASTTTTLDEVVVTGTPLGRTAYDQAQPVSTLTGDQLRQKIAPTLGETLRNEPGVSTSHFTAGASRPIIRGLSDNRVTVLNNGTDILDVSNLSPDHAPSVSPLLSQSIEVVRGAATVLYGSSAIGGVVNVLDNRIPTEIPANGFAGEADTRFDTNDLERSGALSLDLALSDHWVLHLDGSLLKTDDLSIPGHALTGELRDHLLPERRARGDDFGGDPDGSVPNTGVFTRDFGIGTSYVGERGFIGVSFNQYLSLYGVPDDAGGAEPGIDPERVRIDITKRQYSLRAGLRDPFAGFSNADFKFTYVDYSHDELDGSAIGSTFKSRGFDSRLELTHNPIGRAEGSLGTEVSYRDLSVLGDESFLQPTHTLEIAGFVFEELKLEPVRLQLGARVEYNHVKIDSNDPTLTPLSRGDATSQDFLPLSLAAGLIYDFTEDTNAALTFRYSERAPAAEELYALGVHDATFQFLVGDPDLDKERVFGVDLSLRKKAGAVTGSLSGFYNHFSDFIDFTDTGTTDGDGTEIYDYAAKRADFWGGEAQVDFHLLPRFLSRPVAPPDKSVKEIVAPGADESAPNPNDLYLEFKGDYVHAQNKTDGEPLPRITPARLTAALGYESPKIGARLEVERVQSQDRVADLESSIGGYTFLNAEARYTFATGPVNYSVFVNGTNLTNEEARDHTSFLKDVLPLTGRSVVIGLRATF